MSNDVVWSAMDEWAKSSVIRQDELLLCVGFARSRSSNFVLAVQMAQKAAVYADKDGVYLAGFGRDLEQVETALRLIQLVHAWNSAVVFVGGRWRKIWPALEVLHCYRTALLCVDHRAHCYCVEDAPSGFAPEASGSRIISNRDQLLRRQIIYPCRLVRSCFRYNPNHPSTIASQMQACAVSSGYEWCPYLDPGQCGLI